MAEEHDLILLVTNQSNVSRETIVYLHIRAFAYLYVDAPHGVRLLRVDPPRAVRLFAR